MKRSLVLLLVAGLLAAFFFMRSGEDSPDAPDKAASATPEQVGTPSDLVDGRPVLDEARLTESEEGMRAKAALPPEEPASKTGPRVHVFGTVQEEFGPPLEGISVRFHTLRSTWCDTVTSIKDHPAFKTETNAEGFFEFDLPVPTVVQYSLLVTPDPFHTRERLEFGSFTPGALPLLTEGEHDLGTLLLGKAGTISGRVVDETGRAVTDAQVTKGDDDNWWGFVDGKDGTYAWSHIAIGTYELEASAITASDKQSLQVTVRAGVDLEGVNFTLTRCESISGRVVDEDGNPVPSPSVVARAGAGMHVGGGSGGDEAGLFRAYFQEPGPHSLHAKKFGFEPYEGTEFYPGGTEGVVITMKRLKLVRFYVVDDATGKPVERFELRVLRARTLQGGRVSSTVIGRPIQIEDHEDGIFEAPADPRVHDYALLAPGYAPKRAPVLFEELAESLDSFKTMTIRLRRGGSLSGSLAVAGNRVPSPQVQLERAPVPRGPGEEVKIGYQQDEDFDLDRFAGEPREHVGAEDGSFVIEHLAAGTYKVSLRGEGAATVELEAHVAEGETTRLGEVESHSPGKIQGTVFMSGGLPEGGLTVSLGSERFARYPYVRIKASDASFEFDGLDEGTHHVWFPAVDGQIAKGTPFVVELKRGETKQQQFDLSDRVPTRVELHVKLKESELAAAGYPVQLGPHPDGWANVSFDPTDEYGVTSAAVPARPGTVIQVYSPTDFLVGETPPLDLKPGQTGVVELELNPGHLRVQAPMTSENESSGDLYWVKKSNRKGYGREIKLPWSDRGDGFREMDIGFAAPGEYVLTLSPGNRMRDLKVEVQVLAGEEATAVFE